MTNEAPVIAKLLVSLLIAVSNVPAELLLWYSGYSIPSAVYIPPATGIANVPGVPAVARIPLLAGVPDIAGPYVSNVPVVANVHAVVGDIAAIVVPALAAWLKNQTF